MKESKIREIYLILKIHSLECRAKICGRLN
jgi:hypothetical protein